jgi:hypothetical protein
MSYYQLSGDDKDDLREALLQCESINDADTFARLLQQLPKNIKNRAPKHDRLDVHVWNLIQQCIQYRDGLDWLLSVLELFEKRDTPSYDRVLKQIRRFNHILVDDALLNAITDSIRDLNVPSEILETIYYQCLPSSHSSYISDEKPPRSVMLRLLAGIPMQKKPLVSIL